MALLKKWCTDSKSRRHLRWLVFLLLNVLAVRLRRLYPRRLDFILDLKSVKVVLAKKEGESDPPSGYGHAQVLFFGNDQF
jgi:hypothetical protein